MRRRGREESPEVDVSSVFGVDLNHESHPYWILPLSAILFSISIRSSQEDKWTWSFMWEPRVWDFVPLSVQNCQDSRYNYHLYLMNFLPYLHNMWVVPQPMWPHFITVYLYFLKKEIVSSSEEAYVPRDLKQTTYSDDWGVSNIFTPL